MKQFIFMFATFSLLSSSAAYANKNISKEIGTSYNCSGYDPFAKIKYSGKTTVTKSNETYQFVWDYGENPADHVKMLYKGTGIIDEKTATMAVVFSNPAEPNYTGIQFYHIDKKGNLSGHWTITGKDLTGAEDCVKN